MFKIDLAESREVSLKETGPASFYFATFKEMQELKHTLSSIFIVNVVNIVLWRFNYKTDTFFR